MKLISLEIPNEPEALAGWLEERLVGLDLADLVVELKAILAEQDAPAPKLDDVLGAQSANVLSSGLKSLSQEQLHALLRHPKLLLQLQEQVLTEGGSYWSNVKIEFPHLQKASRGWHTINESLNGAEEGPRILNMRAPPTETAGRRQSWSSAIVALAAMVLIALGWWATRPADGPWGFNRPDLMTAQLSREDYLNSLADSAGDWFRQDRDNGEDLMDSLDEFIDGCDTLLAASHPQLPVKDAEWLKERCKVWRGKLQDNRGRVKSGSKPLTEVAADADATIRTLQQALRERAAQPA